MDASKLNQWELQRVVEWFTYHMQMDTRHRLMADMPQEYAKMCADHDGKIRVSTVAAIVSAVEDKMLRRCMVLSLNRG